MCGQMLLPKASVQFMPCVDTPNVHSLANKSGLQGLAIAR